MFSKRPADLCECQLLCVVVAQPQPILRRQAGNGRCYGLLHQLDVSSQARLAPFALCQARRLVCRQRFQTPGASNAIDMPLGQYCTQPGAQTAAAVKVLEQRPPLAISFGEAEQLAVQRVRQLTRTACGIDGIGSLVEQRTMLADEVLPCALVTAGAGTCQCQVIRWSEPR